MKSIILTRIKFNTESQAVDLSTIQIICQDELLK